MTPSDLGGRLAARRALAAHWVERRSTRLARRFLIIGLALFLLLGVAEFAANRFTPECYTPVYETASPDDCYDAVDVLQTVENVAAMIVGPLGIICLIVAANAAKHGWASRRLARAWQPRQQSIKDYFALARIDRASYDRFMAQLETATRPASGVHARLLAGNLLVGLGTFGLLVAVPAATAMGVGAIATGRNPFICDSHLSRVECGSAEMMGWTTVLVVATLMLLGVSGSVLGWPLRQRSRFALGQAIAALEDMERELVDQAHSRGDVATLVGHWTPAGRTRTISAEAR